MNDAHLNFFKSNGIFLYTGEYALTKKEVLEYITILKNNFFILGGDLYVRINGKLCPDAASWSSESDTYTVKESIERSLNFINQFKITDDLFFVISILNGNSQGSDSFRSIDISYIKKALIIDNEWVQCSNKSCEEVFKVRGEEEYLKCPKCSTIQFNPQYKV